MPDVNMIANLLSSVGLRADSVQRLSAGSSSEAWRVESPAEAFVIRFRRPGTDHPPSYEWEFGIRQRLRQVTPLVPEPIATSSDCPSPEENGRSPDWILDRLVEGEFSPRGQIPAGVARGLGEVLAALHAVNGLGFGRPLNLREQVRGMADDFNEGITSRFQDPWPFTGQSVAVHPVAQAAPHLLDRLESAAEKVMAAAEGAQAKVAHTDLHERQLIHSAGKLAALIDFGDSMLGSASWDAASFMYFHGAAQAELMLAGYSSDYAKNEPLMKDGKLLAIPIALHHISRSYSLERPARREFALARLHELLDGRP